MPALPAATHHAVLGTIDIDVGDSHASPDVQWNHHWLDGEVTVLSMSRQGTDYLLRVPDYADFLVQVQPCRVVVSAYGSPDSTTLEHLLLDQILPRLLAQCGELVVHASALAIDGRHALFLGPSGWGKSTLAALLQRNGHGVLSDDCVQLMMTGTRLHAVPTYPSLRLNADSLDAVFANTADTTPVASYSEKHRLAVAPQRLPATSVAVDVLYVLGDPAFCGDSIFITSLSPTEVCMALIQHSFRLDLGDRAATVAQLARCSEIARVTPAFRLDYPRDFARHDQLTRTICSHIVALPARA